MQGKRRSFMGRHKGVMWALAVEMVVVLSVVWLSGGLGRSESHGAGSAKTEPGEPYGLPRDAVAPDFSLRDAHAEDDGPAVRLSELTRRAPVLLIFYRGYACSRCVADLAAIDGRLEEFDKAGLQVVAISQDSPKETRDAIALHGDMEFPMLADPGDAVATAYGLRDAQGAMLHGVFVIGPQRRVRLSVASEEPFGDFSRLLALGYALQGELMGKGRR